MALDNIRVEDRHRADVPSAFTRLDLRRDFAVDDPPFLKRKNKENKVSSVIVIYYDIVVLGKRQTGHVINFIE